MARLKNIQNFQNKAPQLAPSTYVHESAIVIGEVSIGENSSVWPGAVIRGDVNFIRIGKNTNIQDLSILHVNHKSSEMCIRDSCVSNIQPRRRPSGKV